MTLTNTFCALLLLISPSLAINCLSCTGNEGTDCHERPELITAPVTCGPEETQCGNFIQLYQNDGGVHQVTRGCAQLVIATPANYYGTCTTDNSSYIECSTVCSDGDDCNKNMGPIPAGWDDKGNLVGGGASRVASSLVLIISPMLVLVTAA